MDFIENSVTQHNRLVEATYSMGVGELRILEACLSQVHSKEYLEENTPFVLTVEQARDLFYTEETAQNVYRDLARSCRALLKRTATIQLDEDRVLETHFVQSLVFNRKKGYVEVLFANKILPYISSLHRSFTSYKLKYTAKLSSVYAHRIYHLLVMWTGCGQSFKELEIDKLKDMLEIGDSYQGFGMFRQKVVDIAVEQINAHTDYILDVRFLKRGRAYHWIQFRFNRKTDIARAEAEKKAKRLSQSEHNQKAKEKRIEQEAIALEEEVKQAEKKAAKEIIKKRLEAVKKAFPSFSAGTVFVGVKSGNQYIAENENIMFFVNTGKDNISIGVKTIEDIQLLIAQGILTVEKED